MWGCPDKLGELGPCDATPECQAGLVCQAGQCQLPDASDATNASGSGDGSSPTSLGTTGGEGGPTDSGAAATSGVASADADSDTELTGPGETQGDNPEVLLLKEDFVHPAGPLQDAETWSATGQPFTRIAEPSLTYPTYAPDDIGRHAFVPRTTEPPEGEIVSEELVRLFDDEKTLTSSSVCYVAFLVNFGYSDGSNVVELLGLWAEKGYRVPLVYAHPSEVGYYLSLYPPGGALLTTKSALKSNVTYLVVVKYALDASSDERSLFVYADYDVPLSEPWVPLLELHNLPDDNIDLAVPSSVAGVALWRGPGSYGTEVRFDAVRVATSWSGLFL